MVLMRSGMFTPFVEIASVRRDQATKEIMRCARLGPDASPELQDDLGGIVGREVCERLLFPERERRVEPDTLLLDCDLIQIWDRGCDMAIGVGEERVPLMPVHGDRNRHKDSLRESESLSSRGGFSAVQRYSKIETRFP